MRKLLFFTFLLMVVSVPVLFSQAQPDLPPPITPDSGVDVLLQWYDGMYAVLVWILGFFHNAFPINVKDKWTRVAAFAIVAGLFVFIAFTNHTWQEIVSLLFSFALAAGVIYPLGKKAGFKSPSVKLKTEE